MKKLRGIWGLIKRNMLVFFTNKGSIFFSMLTPLIILALYILFLKNTLVSPIEKAVSELGELVSKDDIDRFVNGLLLTGIMSTALLTIPYNALEVMVKDREDKTFFDMSATPVKRSEIIMSYFFAAVMTSFLQVVTVMFLGIGVLTVNGGMYFESADIFKLMGIVLLGTISSTAVLMFFMMFFKNMSTCSAFMGILSAVSGFVVGAYIPLSEFNENIQNVCNLVPSTGISILIRNYLTGGVLKHMDECIGGLDNGEFLRSMKEIFSFNSKVFGGNWELNKTVFYIIIITVVSIFAIRFIYPKTYNKN
ncbi:ABC transporter permease [Butyrivibrio sp. AE3006]|uniref:ABC transporter permease n=1 Tax=Butyrivibrio sp. AE3006 TaxID=1280673 RepID=UPI0004202A39|nr:ABC transporter permease [Butyrivibrio sp. AE3006]